MTGRIALDQTARRARFRAARGMALLFSLFALAGSAWGADAAEQPNSAPPATRQVTPSSSLAIVELRAGFAGRFKVGYWTPLEITLRAGAEAVSGVLEVTVPDGDAVPSRVRDPRARRFRLPRARQKQFSSMPSSDNSTAKRWSRSAPRSARWPAADSARPTKVRSPASCAPTRG